MTEPHDLERLIDRELSQLPAPRAPDTLLPRVIMAAAARSRREPRGEKTGLTPADGWRVAAAAALALLVVVAAGVVSFGAEFGSGPLVRMLRAAEGTTVLMRVMWGALLQPVVTYAVVLVLGLALAGSAAWAAFKYVALEGASQ